MTKAKAKPGTAAELAAIYPGPKRIPVRITRATGKGETRQVEVKTVAVSVYALPIEQLARLVEILEPVMAQMTEPKRVLQFVADNKLEVYAAVAEATSFDVEDVAAFDGDGFLSVVFGIVEMNHDFFVRLLGLAGYGPPGTPSDNGDGPRPSPSFGIGATPIPNATHSPSSTPQ